MDSPPPSSSAVEDAAAQKDAVTWSLVDPFLVEALENPRHRLTVLRMELDIQRFINSPEQHQFEFQHFPSSYLRRAAHRVAHHYGLQTLVLDGGTVDNRAKIVAVKAVENPGLLPIPLSEIPLNRPESPKPADAMKIVIRARPIRSPVGGDTATELRRQDCMNKSVEEREEEYGKARARIFNEEREAAAEEGERSGGRVAAIFRDREKDRTDPDYDRSYQRYVRGALTSQNFNHGMYPGPHGQYELGFPQLRQIQGGGGRYQASGHVLGSHFYSAGCNQNSGDGVYVSPCPSPTMVYAHSYEYLRNTVFQVSLSDSQIVSGHDMAIVNRHFSLSK